MLNSAEHEIFPANSSQITNNSIFFLLNIAEHENFSANKYENANYCWLSSVEHEKSFITLGPDWQSYLILNYITLHEFLKCSLHAHGIKRNLLKFYCAAKSLGTLAAPVGSAIPHILLGSALGTGL